MKVLYLECAMGASGDMLAAALLELLDDPAAFVEEVNAWPLPGVRVQTRPTDKCGLQGTHLRVFVDGKEEGGGHHGHEDAHSHGHDAPGDMARIRGLIQGLPLPEPVKKDAMAVYDLIAGAEAAVHGRPVGQVHFHEVGALDAVADVAMVCALMGRIGAERVVASPVRVGSGQVRCAHGLLPVPAPATARLLLGVPSYGGAIEGELCTPTGAALLRYFADDFGPMPPLRVQRIGYGMGSKDFPAANCLRAFLGLGETSLSETDPSGPQGETDQVVELVCALDDCTGEALGFALEQLLEAGALDAYLCPAQMKKGRPGHQLMCLCRPEDEERMAGLLFRHTTTLGVRSRRCTRRVLARRTQVLDTPWGPVRVKTSEGYGVRRQKPEYEDLAAIARKRGVSLEEVWRDVAAKDEG